MEQLSSYIKNHPLKACISKVEYMTTIQKSMIIITGIVSFIAGAYFFTWSFFPIVFIAALLIFFFPQSVFDFVLLNYEFIDKKPSLRKQLSMPNMLANDEFLQRFANENPDIVVEIISDDTNMAGEATFIDGKYHLRIQRIMLEYHTPEEFAALVMHEKGHIYYGDNIKMNSYFLSGYLLLLFFPFAMPIFWLVGNYVSRENEYRANEYAAKKTSTKAVIAMLTTALENDEPNDPSDWFLNWVSYFTFESHPRISSQIERLQKHA